MRGTEEGANLVEYALLLAGIALAVYLVVSLIGDMTADNVRSVVDNLPERPGGTRVTDSQSVGLGQAGALGASSSTGQLPRFHRVDARPAHPGPPDRAGRADSGPS